MRNPNGQAWGAAAPADLLSAGVIGVLAIVALATFRDYGLAWDDFGHSRYGGFLYSYYASGFADRSAFSYYNLYYYGGGFDLAAAALAKLLPFDPFETRRLVGAAVGILGLVVVWRLARRLSGPVAGFAALTLLAVAPVYYGHMYINAKDIPFAAAMIFLLYALVRAFDEHPRPRPLTIALFGLALGLTIGTRLIGGIAVLFVAVAAGVLLVGESEKFGWRGAALRLAKLFGWLLLGLPLAYVVMGIVWPWSVLDPLNPLRALQFYSRFWEQPWKEMFDGVPVPIPDMPRTYVVKLCLLKLPEVLVAFAIGGTAGAIATACKRKVAPRRRAALALLVSAAVLPVLLAAATKPIMYNGIRHYLFVIPPFAVLAGFAAAAVYERLASQARSAAAVAATVFVALIGLTVVELIRIHPYQYALFNHLAGGVAGARNYYMLDYWGLGLKEASEGLLERLQREAIGPPTGRKWKVAVCGPPHTVSFELGPDFEVSNDAKGADFALSLGTFYCARLDAPVLSVAEREGVVFARAYDLRGRSVASTYAPARPDDVAVRRQKVPTFWHDEEDESATKAQ